ESFVAAAAMQIRPSLTIAESRRADGKLIGRLRRERRYFRTVATTYAQEVAHSLDYCARIMDYCQSREVYTSTLVTQMEALRREEVAHSLDYCARIIDYCQSRGVHTSTLVTQMEALRRETTTPEEAYAMTWASLKKKMTGKYCPRGEIKKIEIKMWNLK
nr:hypothetical protein [Tanacetum cinerariifolium]